MRLLGDLLQAGGALALWGLFRLLPLRGAAALGGGVARIIGPHLGVHRLMLRNLQRAFPEKTAAAHRQIALQVWDNLGRSAGEWAHLPRLRTTGADSRLELLGAEHLQAAQQSGRPFIMVTAHLANWEIPSLSLSARGLAFGAVYRRASNPLAEGLMLKMRAYRGVEMIPKGRSGARRILQTLKSGRPLGLMADQKLDDGMSIPFFGDMAMTAPAPAELALRLRCDLLPLQVVRLPGSRFRMIVHPPMPLPDSGDRAEDIRLLLCAINNMLEDWIRQHPGQWLWVHNRWPKDRRR